MAAWMSGLFPDSFQVVPRWSLVVKQYWAT